MTPLARRTLATEMNAEAIKTINLNAALNGNSQELVQILRDHPKTIADGAVVRDCIRGGYAPKGYGLADFTIIRSQDRFHLFHIPRVAGNSCIDIANEHWLGHATSFDLDSWTTRDPALCVEPANYFESSHVWAPFVHREGETTTMFYTGLTAEPSQVLCIAQAVDSDLGIWQRADSNPVIPLCGFDWHWKNHKGNLRHARDPHVVKVRDLYLLAYTTMHRNGCPAVGGLVSEDLLHWEDVGPILYRPMGRPSWMPESVNIQPMQDGTWVLIPSQSPGLEYYISEDPFHWHGLLPTQIQYRDGANDFPIGLEVILKMRTEWLVAYFGNDRMFIGILEIDSDPWSLRRVNSSVELVPWLSLVNGESHFREDH